MISVVYAFPEDGEPAPLPRDRGRSQRSSSIVEDVIPKTSVESSYHPEDTGDFQGLEVAGERHNTTKTTVGSEQMTSIYDDEKQEEANRMQAFLFKEGESCLKRPLYGGNSSWCPRVWDQLLCWDSVPPGKLVTNPCPPFVQGFKVEGSTAFRRCGVDGVWESKSPADFLESSTNSSEIPKGWTNYTLCVADPTYRFDPAHEKWILTIKQLSTVGYSVSLATLVISFIILASLRKLRCPRNLLHLHLFASFMLRAAVVLLRSYLLNSEMAAPLTLSPESAAVGGKSIDYTSEAWYCKLLVSVWQYFIVANYSWLLMEGLYLHSLIFMALFTDSSAITLYILLGWGLPLGCVSLWVTLRATLDNIHCWMITNVQWIFWFCIRAPVAISNLINFFFFLNVVRVLVLKLRSSISAESMKYRKLGKSTLVLVPLFGVHYFVLWGLSTSTNPTVEIVWLFLDQVFASFQGFFVAVLYCLMNGEVRQELRKLYNRLYKGDPLVLTSHSTQVSHTKTYASRGRTSVHSIYSQGDRRDRSTPSPQMPRSGYMDGGGNISRPRTATPSPTATLTPSYGSRQQSRDVSTGLGSTESCEEAIELRPRATSVGSRSLRKYLTDFDTITPLKGGTGNHSPSKLGSVSSIGPNDGAAVEILIDLHDGNCSYKKEPSIDASEEPTSDINNGHPLQPQNIHSNGKSKEKHLTFSESTEELLNSKAIPRQENGCLLTDNLKNEEEITKGIVCINVNKKSLKSTTPLQVEASIVKKSNRTKDQETMV